MFSSKEKINLLDTIPVCSSHIKMAWEGEYIVLAFPRFKHAWMQRFLLPKGMPDIHVTLEEHGTAIWQLIDGRRTVGEIVELMGEHFHNEAGYASRVTTYFMQLQKDGFIQLTSNGSV